MEYNFIIDTCLIYRAPASLFYYWLVEDFHDVTVIIHPTDVIIPTDELITGELSNLGVEVVLYGGDTTQRLTESFGYYFDGQVYDRDVEQLEEVVQRLWEEMNEGALQDGFTVNVVTQENYLTRQG